MRTGEPSQDETASPAKQRATTPRRSLAADKPTTSAQSDRRHSRRAPGRGATSPRLLGVGVPVAAAREKEQQGPSVVVQWNAAALAAMLALKKAPRSAVRAGHTPYLHVRRVGRIRPQSAGDAARDACVSRRNTARRPRRQGVSYAAYRALLDLFPSQASAFVALLTQLGYHRRAHVDRHLDTRGNLGNVAAQAELNFRHGDGSNQLGGYADTAGGAPVK